jgi:hypothetical protein
MPTYFIQIINFTKVMLAPYLLVLYMLILASSYAQAQATAKEEAATKAQQIMQQVIERNDGASQYSLTKLASCAYKLVNKRKKCARQPRIKQFESLTKDIGKQGQDTKTLNLIIAPASEAGMAFLQTDYGDDQHDSQQWLYLPALKKLKRIVSATDNGAKTGSVFGSEIAYEDIEKRHLADNTYQLLAANSKFGQYNTWTIKSTPTPAFAAKTSYSYVIAYIDKTSLIPVKIELYKHQEQLVKTIYHRKLIKHQGIWLARKMLVINHSNQRMSQLSINKYALDIPLADALLGKRALTDNDYRETQMRQIRQAAIQ